MASRGAGLLGKVSGALRHVLPKGEESLVSSKSSTSYNTNSSNNPPNTAASIIYNTRPQMRPISPQYRDSWLKRNLYSHSVISVSFILGGLGIVLPTIAFITQQPEPTVVENTPGYAKYHVDRVIHAAEEEQKSVTEALLTEYHLRPPSISSPPPSSYSSTDKKFMLEYIDNTSSFFDDYGAHDIRVGLYKVNKADLKNFIENHPLYGEETKEIDENYGIIPARRLTQEDYKQLERYKLHQMLWEKPKKGKSNEKS